MGLDMYLTAERYISQYSDPDLSAKANELLDDNPGPVRGIICEAIYWRKANAIHKWFVDNIQSGDDNCGEYYVNKVDLEMLRTLCKKVQAEPDRASELLPSQSGFFFGSTLYDDAYFYDIEQTIAILDSVLDSEVTDLEYYYSSSW